MSNSHQRKKKRKTRIKGPPLFSDFGKKANDLLIKGYSKDQILSITTRHDTGLTLTSTTKKQGRHSTACVAAQYKNNVIEIKVDRKSHITATLNFCGKLLPSTNTAASLTLPDYTSSKLKVQSSHYHKHAALAMSVALNRTPALTLSATFGTASIAFGMDATYKITSCCFTKYNAGITVAKSDFNASIILANRGDFLRASYVHYLDKLRQIAAGAEVTRMFSTKEKTFAVGASCAVDHCTMVKVKLNNHGKLKTLLQHKFRPKSYLTISSEFETKALGKTPRIGLALALVL